MEVNLFQYFSLNYELMFNYGRHYALDLYQFSNIENKIFVSKALKFEIIL